jgi:hypothetical protein
MMLLPFVVGCLLINNTIRINSKQHNKVLQRYDVLVIVRSFGKEAKKHFKGTESFPIDSFIFHFVGHSSLLLYLSTVSSLGTSVARSM